MVEYAATVNITQQETSVNFVLSFFTPTFLFRKIIQIFAFVSLTCLVLCAVVDVLYCAACGCEIAGVMGGDIDCARSASAGVAVGDCVCKTNVASRNCNVCKPEFWKLDVSNPNGCQRMYY